MTWWKPWTWLNGGRDKQAVEDARARLQRVLDDDSTVDEVTAQGRRIVRENGFVYNIERALRVRHQ